MTNPTNSGKGIWEPSPWYMAQVIHVLAGAFILFAGTTHGLSVGWLYASFFLVTALKEFALDTASWFEGDTWGGSAWDFGCYQVGAIGGIVASCGHFWLGTVLTSSAVLVLFGIDLANQTLGWSIFGED